MNFLSGNKATVFKTPLTERMLGNIDVSDFTPLASVVLVVIRIALETLFVVIPVGLPGVLIAEVTGC